MEQVAKFYKVSYEQFKKDFDSCFVGTLESVIKLVYDGIKLPTRATTGSAGYDFHSTVNIKLYPGESVKIPTGIRCAIKDGWVLQLFPRSGLGFKYRLQLNNTVGIIDSDYYGSYNEGHIFAKITNDSNECKSVILKYGDAFMQGIFLPYGITTDDTTNGVRNGGFGSTGGMNE